MATHFPKKRRWIWLVPFSALMLTACGGNKAPLRHENFLYSAVGTSDIFGLGAFPLTNGYTFRIQDELRGQGRIVSLLQIGIPSANTDLVANSVRKASENGLSAEFATVWVGANDLINGVPVETFGAELDELLETLQEDMEAYVVIANLPSIHTLQNFIDEPVPEVTESRVDQFNALINAQAIARGIPIVNLADDAIEGHIVTDFDGLHPDEEGHERLAMLFMKMIRPVL